MISKFVGDTEQNIREVFHKARNASPSVIFFDEFDSMSRRDTGHDSLSPVTALLTEMDGIEGRSGVVVLAATNRPQVIDKALLRPGRFDKVMFVGPPNLEAREQILSIYTRERPMSGDVNLKQWAQRTEGWSGAEVNQLCNLAATHAMEGYVDDEKNDSISQTHFEAAFNEITPGISQSLLKELREWSVAGVEKLVEI